MIKEAMKVDPKGQVVIPKIFREAFGITPGSKVIFELRKEGILNGYEREISDLQVVR